MKSLRLIIVAAVLALGVTVGSAQTNNYSFTFGVNQNIPDGNPSGLTLMTNLTGMVGSINDLSLTLNITNAAGTSAFNGDLYAYLVRPNGGFSVLLNRSGVTSGNSFGYSDTGYAVTFTVATGSDIHFYQPGGSLNPAGQLTGSWLPDGRQIDPQSSPALFDSTSPTALLDSFLTTDPNGTWTFFFADLSSGSQAKLQDITLNIQTVPEPSVWALVTVSAIAVVFFRRPRRA